MLHEFVIAHRDEIINRCRVKVTARADPQPTRTEIDRGVPVFLEQLAGALRLGRSATPEITKTSTQHGHDLLLQGFTVSQVVHDYGDVCQVITEMAVERHTPIATEDFRLLNKCLDDAIAAAVTEYGREREPPRGARDGEHEHLQPRLRELRTSIQIAVVALEMIKSGRVGTAGSTGTLLDRTLFGAQTLIDRLLAEVYDGSHRETDPVN